MHDPEVYKDPSMVFKPERLIVQPGKPAELHLFTVAFDYGRQ